MMNLKILFGILIISLFPGQDGKAQFCWPHGCKAAVCLTYDDGWDNHLDIVVPQLDSFGLNGTFFVPGHAKSLYNRLPEWRKIAENGHEIGNHTLFHPCDWSSAGISRPYGHGDLKKYSYEQLMMELQTANTLLKAVDNKEVRTFAYTCGNYLVENTDFSDSIIHLFMAARAAGPIPESMDDFNVFKTPSWCVPENTTAEQLIAYCEQAREKGTIAIFMFHSIGGTPGHGWFNVESSEHMKLLKYISENSQDYYCANFKEIMEYIKNRPVKKIK